MEYTYTAVSDTGIKKTGIIEAASEKDIAVYLKKNNMFPISIKKKGNNDLIEYLPFQGVKGSDIVLFTRQLSSMIMTGLTLVESLNILKKQATNPALQTVLEDLVANLSEGKTLSQSLSNHKDVFSEVYISLIKAAEAGGMLDKILERLANNLEQSEELSKNIKSALFYPAIIIIGMIGVIVIMNIFVIPQLTSMYKGMNIELPAMTQMVMMMSDLFTKYFVFMFLGCIIGIFALLKFSKTERGKRVIGKLLLKMPVFGSIVVLSVLVEISRTLSLLIRSGTSIIEALHISANVANNIWYKDAVMAAASMVEKGFNLSTAFENQTIFPTMFVQMLKVGEETGKIDDSLERLSDYFQRDLNIKIKTLTTAMEPILILVLGVVVGFLILSIITPIYGLITNIK